MKYIFYLALFLSFSAGLALAQDSCSFSRSTGHGCSCQCECPTNSVERLKAVRDEHLKRVRVGTPAPRASWSNAQAANYYPRQKPDFNLRRAGRGIDVEAGLKRRRRR